MSVSHLAKQRIKMKFTFVIFAVLALGVNCQFKFRDCGDRNAILKFNNFVASPDPLVFNWLTHLQLSADVDVKETLQDDLEVSLKIKKVGRLLR